MQTSCFTEFYSPLCAQVLFEVHWSGLLANNGLQKSYRFVSSERSSVCPPGSWLGCSNSLPKTNTIMLTIGGVLSLAALRSDGEPKFASQYGA